MHVTMYRHDLEPVSLAISWHATRASLQVLRAAGLMLVSLSRDGILA